MSLEPRLIPESIMAKPTPPASSTSATADNGTETEETVTNAGAPPNTDVTAEDLASTSAAEENFLDADVTVEDRNFGMQFPLVQYVNGSPAKKREGGIAYTGGFFLSGEQGITLPGFEPYTLVTREGAEIAGYASRTLTGSIIRYRRGFLAVPEKDGALPQRFANSEYDLATQVGKVRGQTHVLMVPKGSTETVMVSFRGLGSKAVAGMGKDRGAIPSFGSRVVGRATQMAKQAGRPKTFPLCSFLITIGPAMLDDGAPKFTEVGKKDKSMITLPVWLDAPTGQVTQEALNKLYVGQSVFQKAQAEFTATEAWFDEWSEESLVARRAKNNRKAASDEDTDGTDGANGDEAGTGKPASKEIPF